MGGLRGSTRARTRRAANGRSIASLPSLRSWRPCRPRCPTRPGVARVPPDPYLRIDTNDYSLDPALVGRRVEVIVDQRHVTAVCLDTGEIAGRHARVFARHRTITALEHARTLKAGHGVCAQPSVEVRPLARYDALIA